jgi:hypothetical protein
MNPEDGDSMFSEMTNRASATGYKIHGDILVDRTTFQKQDLFPSSGEDRELL